MSASTETKPRTPADLKVPAYAMSAPFTFATTVANNVWMSDYGSDEERLVHYDKAHSQWLSMYSYFASDALVYVVPSPTFDGSGNQYPDELQDLPFVANLGIVLHHLEVPTFVLANFKSEPRKCEEQIGRLFFQQMGYTVVQPLTHFEGEAELKHLYDNVYIGGYGQRSDIETYRWMEEQFGMKIVKLNMVSEYFYHLDCTIFPLTAEKTLVCTEVYEEDELAAIEEVTEIVDVTEDECMGAICNSVRCGQTVVNASHINELSKDDEDYALELAKNRRLEDLCREHALEPVLVNISEFLKGGAALSCCFLHLNRNSYDVPLI